MVLIYQVILVQGHNEILIWALVTFEVSINFKPNFERKLDMGFYLQSVFQNYPRRLVILFQVQAEISISITDEVEWDTYIAQALSIK